MKKRLLSLLLVLAMVFSLMPAALAADKPSFQSFFESVGQRRDGARLPEQHEQMESGLVGRGLCAQVRRSRKKQSQQHPAVDLYRRRRAHI